MTKAANLAASANATAGNVTATALQSNAASTPTLFKDSAGTEVGTLCRAWANFNGVSGSVAIRASFNVSSVTRVSTGLYLVSLTNAMPDANYSSIASAQPNGYTGANAGTGTTNAGSQTASQVSIEVRDYTNNAVDTNFVQFAIFR